MVGETGNGPKNNKNENQNLVRWSEKVAPQNWCGNFAVVIQTTRWFFLKKYLDVFMSCVDFIRTLSMFIVSVVVLVHVLWNERQIYLDGYGATVYVLHRPKIAKYWWHFYRCVCDACTDNSTEKTYIMMEARLGALFKSESEYTVVDR